MASTFCRPCAVSICSSSPIGRARPDAASTWASSTAAACTSAAVSTLGSMIRSSRAPACSTTSIRSLYMKGVSRALMRTETVLAPQSSRFRASTAMARAAALSAAGTASSRSSSTTSAALAAAFSMKRREIAGTASCDRFGRPAPRSDEGPVLICRLGLEDLYPYVGPGAAPSDERRGVRGAMRIAEVAEFYAPNGGGVRTYIDRKFDAARAPASNSSCLRPGWRTRSSSGPAAGWCGSRRRPCRSTPTTACSGTPPPSTPSSTG